MRAHSRECRAPELLDRAGKLGLEGLIGKRAGSPVARFRFSVIGPLLACRFYREKIIRHPLSSNSSGTTIKRQPHPQHEACMFIAAKLSSGTHGRSTEGLG
jgi:hypothetical protein